ncbi:hypothetical protein [Klebsiella pneumoniae]|nr:hypothetical protein [Klebsiella pneumoniae]
MTMNVFHLPDFPTKIVYKPIKIASEENQEYIFTGCML